MRRRGGAGVTILVVLAMLVANASPALAYLKLGVTAGSKPTTLKWALATVPYYVEDRGVPGVSATDAQAAIGRAFGTWQAVPSSTIAYQFAGYTAALPLEQDGRSTLGFLERPELDRVLASTNYLIDEATGTLLESDIFFNSTFAWSVAAGGEAGKYDFESVALHEIGHFSGLGHSALGETELQPSGSRIVVGSAAVMFPIAYRPGSTEGRVLRADDVAGISDLYPAAGFDAATGSLSGHVTKNGQGVYGAHVVAFNPVTGLLVGAFALGAGGAFSMAGLQPGVWVVRVEPLDDADSGDFFDSGPLDLSFKVTFSPRLAVVPRGGDSGNVDVAVTPK